MWNNHEIFSAWNYKFNWPKKNCFNSKSTGFTGASHIILKKKLWHYHAAMPRWRHHWYLPNDLVQPRWWFKIWRVYKFLFVYLSPWTMWDGRNLFTYSKLRIIYRLKNVIFSYFFMKKRNNAKSFHHFSTRYLLL